jgi:hypothetical protein
MSFESLNDFCDLNQLRKRKIPRTALGRPSAQGRALHGLAAAFAWQAVRP